MNEEPIRQLKRLADIAVRRPEHLREQELAQAVIDLLTEREKLRDMLQYVHDRCGVGPLTQANIEILLGTADPQTIANLERLLKRKIKP